MSSAPAAKDGAVQAPTSAAGFHGSKGITWKRKLQLKPELTPNDLPVHTLLESSQTDPPALDAFLKQLFYEARVQSHLDFKPIGTFKSNVTSGNGTSYPVTVHKSKSSQGEDAGIVWFQRSSEHEEDKPVKYQELDACLRVDHEKNESEYTPAIYDVNTVLEWDLKGKEFHWDEEGESPAGGMKELEMKITQMHHAMPGPGLLGDRVFTVLLISFINTRPFQGAIAESIDMQIPINLRSFPTNVLSLSHINYSTSKMSYRNDSPDATDQQKSKVGKAVVEGKYVSLERLSKMDGKSKWDMMTASDAGGNLPGWMQRMGVAGAISKDVPLALEYIIRKKKGEQD